jgi:hypothetical protein
MCECNEGLLPVDNFLTVLLYYSCFMIKQLVMQHVIMLQAQHAMLA